MNSLNINFYEIVNTSDKNDEISISSLLLTEVPLMYACLCNLKKNGWREPTEFAVVPVLSLGEYFWNITIQLKSLWSLSYTHSFIIS